MIKSHFFGKDCIINRELSDRFDIDLKLKEKNFEASHLLLLNQIHSSQVFVVDNVKKIYGTQDLPKADAIVTNLKNIAIGVVTADCGPILFYDEKKEIIAAAHAGWRGARSGIVEATINAIKNLGATNIKAKIGPMIQQNSYEVSQEFFDDFLQENITNNKFFKNGISADKYWFDLPSYIAEKLQNCGISEIINHHQDTYSNEKEFFSFRRSTHQKEKDCGRNVSVIAISK